MPQFLPQSARPDARVMMFIDGENLAIRYKACLGVDAPVSHVQYIPDVMVWSPHATRIRGPQDFIRRYYYTSALGADDYRNDIEEQLKKLGIEAPRVFPRNKDGRSKGVDITLATDMLTHAHRKNFDIAILITGDGDYVPLVEAVKREGCRVVLWALERGLSPALKKAADHYWDIGELFFRESTGDTVFTAIYT